MFSTIFMLGNTTKSSLLFFLKGSSCVAFKFTVKINLPSFNLWTDYIIQVCFHFYCKRCIWSRYELHSKKANKLCGRPPQYASPYKLTFDLLTLKVVSESRVTWATSVPILVFLGLSVLDLGYQCTRQTDRRQTCIIA